MILSVPFPLTLTLSPWEREQPLPVCKNSDSTRAEVSSGFAKTLGAFFQLPKGEGRGEGEGDKRI